MKHILIASLVLALGMAAGTAQADKLRIISWADYVPADLIAAFKKETGIDVEVTLSNNEEMISKLRATGGAGYDLAQPSQDRIAAAQREFGIYKPLDLAQGQARAVPAAISRHRAQEHHPRRQGVRAALSLGHRRPGRQRQAHQDRRLSRPVPRRPQGQDRGSPAAPDADGLCVRRRQGSRSRCTAIRRPTARSWIRWAPRSSPARPNFKFFYDNKDQLLNGIRSGEVVAAMMWDTGGWTLNRENPDIQFIVPRSGALGLARHLRAAGARPQRRRGLCLDQFHHAPGKCRAGHQVGGQLLRGREHGAADRSAPQGAVRRGLSRTTI